MATEAIVDFGDTHDIMLAFIVTDDISPASLAAPMARPYECFDTKAYRKRDIGRAISLVDDITDVMLSIGE